MRWRWNLPFFVGVQSSYVAVLAAASHAPLGIALTMLIVAMILTLPMLPVYLLAVARIPPWSPVRRRATAVIASPLLLAVYAYGLGAWFAAGFELLLLALPGALAYGAAVRLPETAAAT